MKVLGTLENDTLKNTAEIEVISGDEGLDKVVFVDGKQGISVNLKTGAVVDSYGNKETMSGVEIVIGTTISPAALATTSFRAATAMTSCTAARAMTRSSAAMAATSLSAARATTR
jgi:hypothetical protein